MACVVYLPEACNGSSEVMALEEPSRASVVALSVDIRHYHPERQGGRGLPVSGSTNVRVVTRVDAAINMLRGCV